MSVPQPEGRGSCGNAVLVDVLVDALVHLLVDVAGFATLPPVGTALQRAPLSASSGDLILAVAKQKADDAHGHEHVHVYEHDHVHVHGLSSNPQLTFP